MISTLLNNKDLNVLYFDMPDERDGRSLLSFWQMDLKELMNEFDFYIMVSIGITRIRKMQTKGCKNCFTKVFLISIIYIILLKVFSPTR